MTRVVLLVDILDEAVDTLDEHEVLRHQHLLFGNVGVREVEGVHELLDLGLDHVRLEVISLYQELLELFLLEAFSGAGQVDQDLQEDLLPLHALVLVVVDQDLLEEVYEGLRVLDFLKDAAKEDQTEQKSRVLLKVRPLEDVSK